MNLLPEQYIERSKRRERGSRLAVVIIVTLCAVAAVVTHSRFAMTSAVQRLVEAQSMADEALKLEVDASSLKRKKTNLERFLERYQNEEIIFPMGDLVSTLANLLPEEMTLEELSLDIIETEDGNKGISGRLAGFAASDDVIAKVVTTLQEQALYDTVSMDFSRSREIRGMRARGFKMSFFIDLSKPWVFSRTIADAGGEE